MDYIKVKDKDHLLRDAESNGIVNADIEGYNKYIAAYKRKYAEAKKIKNMEDEISSIKSDLGEIKDLLRRIVSDGTC
jgi:wobble nucleotide-excising tRNase